MAPFQAIPALLAEMDVDPNPIIDEAGIDPALFDNADNTIPFYDAGRLLDLCVTRTGCMDLGLRLGETMTPALLGLVGALGNSAPDVGTALRSMIEYFHLHDRAAIPAMQIDGDQVVLSYTLHAPGVPATEQIYDVAIMYGQGIMRTLADQRWQSSEVRLSRRKPECIEPYRRRFRTPLRFDSGENANVFAAFWLDRPVVSADAPTHHALMQLIEMLDEQIGRDLVARLHRMLRVLLTSGVGDEELSLDYRSRAVAVHRRTLNRRLRKRGTSFKTLVNEARYDIARQLLRDTHLSVLQISDMLDYADAPTFTRAFRRWFGTTPANWRNAHKRV